MTQPNTAALFRSYPALAASIPRIELCTLPTRVDRCDVAGRPILVKRDDLCAAGYAGNKARKLEFLLGDARARSIDRLVTAGATGSHHAFATAYHGAQHGFDVSLVLFPQSRTPHVREVLMLDTAVGAELRWASRMETVPYGLWRARYEHRQERSHVIAPGGSDAVGTLGYVSAGLELAEQVAAGDVPRPTSIRLAAGTLGTLVGIAIGLAWAGLDIPVIGVRVTSALFTNDRLVRTVLRATLARLHDAGASPPRAEDVLRLITLDHSQFGAGYGLGTDAGAAAERVFDTASLRLDPTYTAKAAAALLTADATDELPLFWHTLSAVAPLELLDTVTEADLPPPFRRYLARV
jgi:D-cysteine desulfhydrase